MEATAQTVTGSRSLPPWWSRIGGDIDRVVLVSLLVVVLAILSPPLLVLIFGSLTQGDPGTTSALTLESIRIAYSRPGIYAALGNSVVFASVVATIVLVLGAFLAWIVERTDSSIKRFAQLFAVAPMIMPSILLISAWIMILGPRNGIVNLFAAAYLGRTTPLFDIMSFGGMVFVAVLQELPLAFLWLWPVFRSVNPELEEAALLAGAGLVTTLRRVTLSMLRPAFVAAWLIFFIFALGAISVPLLLGLPAKIFLFSTEIYLATSKYPTNLNVACAYALVYVVVAVVGMVVYRRLVKNSERYVTIGGKGVRPRVQRLGKWGMPITIFGVLLLVLTAGLPMVALAWTALMPFPQAPSLTSLGMITFKNFGAALEYGPAQRAVFNSLFAGIVAGLVATGLGVLIAWYNLRIRGSTAIRATLDTVATAPVGMPGIVFGVGFLVFSLLVPFPLFGTIWLLVLTYVALHLPYSVRICSSAFVQIHPELEDAGYVCGAGRGRVLWKIVLRLSLGAVIASMVYVSLRSFREYAASIFLTSHGTEVFSVLVLDMWEGGNSTILAAYVTMVMILIAVLTGAYAWLNKRLASPTPVAA